MNEPFDIIFANKKLMITPDESDHLVDGFVIGCFKISDNETEQGTICFGQTVWEYDKKGNLSTEEIEAVADEIIFYYKEDELENGYVDYTENKITVFNGDEEIVALIEKQHTGWHQTSGEKLSEERIAAYVKGTEYFQ